MKIVFIISSLGTGGAERVLSILSNNLIKKYDISIILLSNDNIFYDLDKNIKISKANLYIKSFSIIEKIKNNLNRIVKLKNIIKNENPDIVISFMTQTNILSIIASKLSDKKIIISERINYNFLQSKIWRLLRRLIYPFADGLIVQSQYDKQKYQYHHKCKVILNPLDIKDRPIKKANIILAVGRIDHQKGFDRLIKAYTLLDTTWKLLIIGDGEKRDEIQRLIDENILTNNVVLLGTKSNIEEYYAQASIFTLSSRMEGFPNVLVEAMGYGCACVAFDCLTGPRDIVENGKNGFLVKDGDIKQYAEKIQELIDDSKLREELSNEGKKIVNKLAVPKITDEWNNVIKEVLCAE